MTIEFECKFCQSILRVPDENAGDRARCPSCQSIVSIPGNRPASPLQNPNAESASQSSASKSSDPYSLPDERAEPTSPYGAGNASTPNPYASSQPVPQSAWPFENPYQPTTMAPPSLGTNGEELARQRLFGAGIVMLIISIPGSAIYAISFFGAMAEAFSGRLREEDLISLVIVFFMLAGQITSLIGGVAMIRRRGYWLAFAGSLAQIATGWCCCIPALVGIYALSVVCGSDAKRAMSLASR